MIDRVLVHAGAFGDDLSHLTTHTPDETRGALTLAMPRVVRKDSMQIVIVNVLTDVSPLFHVNDPLVPMKSTPAVQVDPDVAVPFEVE